MRVVCGSRHGAVGPQQSCVRGTGHGFWREFFRKPFSISSTGGEDLDVTSMSSTSPQGGDHCVAGCVSFRDSTFTLLIAESDGRSWQVTVSATVSAPSDARGHDIERVVSVYASAALTTAKYSNNS